MKTALTLDDFMQSETGMAIGKLLERPEIVRSMERLSHEGRPAVLAVDAALPDDVRLGDTEKRHVGRWVRDILFDRGWRIGKRLHFRSGRVFSSGTVYVKPSVAPPSAADTAATDWDARIAAAQALVRQFSINDYSVDDFIADKRAEAARENERWA